MVELFLVKSVFIMRFPPFDAGLYTLDCDKAASFKYTKTHLNDLRYLEV